MSEDRVVVLTGATDGLGRALAHRLAGRAGTLLILHGRNPSRLAAVESELAEHRARIVTVVADLSEMVQVHHLADDITTVTDRVNVLVNNAGVGFGEPDGTDRRLTADGNELRFAVNHLAPFALTRDLVPLLRAGAPARVVNVASIGQAEVDLDDPTLAHGYDGWQAYRRSKLAMIAAGFALAEELPADQVTVNSVHPATFMPTKMVLHAGQEAEESLETGVASVMRLVDDPALEGVTGRFFNRQAEAQARPAAYDPDYRGRLVRLSEELTRRGTRP
ncbi:SDR family NAD(P)-dependent oxidoreductase [Propionicicella superfundia]|uniref:SDR family NAD(P)-dependent oxidoreductase n=1 Tax=Propionicicella superfundia TaxID=348582 RepID=UPI00040B98E4|nr:SDR family NAD(P)-dependent oxidoreductase [Propionicicella superfundia]